MKVTSNEFIVGVLSGIVSMAVFFILVNYGFSVPQACNPREANTTLPYDLSAPPNICNTPTIMKFKDQYFEKGYLDGFLFAAGEIQKYYCTKYASNPQECLSDNQFKPAGNPVTYLRNATG